MDGQKFLELCIEKIVDIVNRYGVSNSVSAKDVLIVRSCKTLQNNKTLLGIQGSDEYYEVTYNGDKKELYVDIYSKGSQAVFKNVE